MKTIRICSLLMSTLLSGILALESNNKSVISPQETKSEIPFVFSFYDNADPALNPFAERSTNFHLTIITGRIGSVLGLQVGGLFNHVKYDFTGFDATGISSTIEGDFSGFQADGIFNRINGSFVGIQETGFYSFVGSDYIGIQTTGIITQVEGAFKGIQIAGISNTVKQQIKGIQIAGIVNNAGRVDGIQVGLVNLSGELNGLAIGLVNISKAGSVHGVAWSGGAMDMNAGIKFAPNNYWYTILSLGRGGDFNDENSNGNGAEDNTSIGYHMGFRIPMPLVSSLFAELDIGSNAIFTGDLLDDREWENKVSSALDARASLVFRLHKRLSIIAGIVQTRTGDDISQFSGGKTEKTPFFGIQI